MKTQLFFYFLFNVVVQLNGSHAKIIPKARELAKELLALEKSQPDKSEILNRYLTPAGILHLSERTAEMISYCYCPKGSDAKILAQRAQWVSEFEELFLAEILQKKL